MSTAVFTTLQSSGGTVPTETLRRGSAKAWMNLNGSGTIALRDSFNVSSVVDNTTGDYTQNFTNALANSNYASNSICGQGAGSSQGRVTITPTQLAPTTASLRTRSFDLAGALQDTDHLSVGAMQ